MGTSRYKSWGRSRANRLPSAVYPEGMPVHVTIGAHLARPVFADRALATAVFSSVASDPETLAACLMPDHLHWLLADASCMTGTVRRVKSFTTRLAWCVAGRRKIWQRSFWDHVIRRDRDLRAVAWYIVGNPVRKGLVREVDEYPFQIMKL